jgi:hypothetical protein
MSPEHVRSSIFATGQRLFVLLAAALGCVGLVYLSLQALPHRDISSWPVSQGHVTAMRTRVKQVHDGKQGGVAALEAEILVSYNAQGKPYLRWFSLPARPAGPSQQLAEKPAQLEGSLCTVHWKQTHPFEAFVTECPEY